MKKIPIFFALLLTGIAIDINCFILKYITNFCLENGKSFSGSYTVFVSRNTEFLINLFSKIKNKI